MPNGVRISPSDSLLLEWSKETHWNIIHPKITNELFIATDILEENRLLNAAGLLRAFLEGGPKGEAFMQRCTNDPDAASLGSGDS